MTMTPSPLLCVPLTQPTPEEMVSVLHAPELEFDLAEVRVDYLHTPVLEPLLACSSCPLLFTNRADRDHGSWKGTESERLEILNHAVDLGAEWVDIERECLSLLRRKSRCKTIVSYHNFKETPGNLLEIAQAIEQMDGDVVKVATLARSHRDNARMFEVLRTINKPVIGVTMGPYGHVVRILGPKLGAFLVFASLTTGQESAPGQIPARDLLKRYRFREMNHETDVYGLVDLPSGEQWSKVLNRVFTETQQNAVAIPLETGDIEDVLSAYQSLTFQGFSLGAIHWEKAKRLVDNLEGGSQVVDTITWRDGQWTGYDSGAGSFHGGNKGLDTASRLVVQWERWTGKSISREWLLDLMQELKD